MSSTIPQRRAGRAISPPAATHLFEVGQVVQLKGGFGRLARGSDVYHVTRTLPPRGDAPQYRIRNDLENYERVVMQDELIAIRTPKPGDGTTLIERTFNDGQGTKTQQARDQKTEEGEGSVQA